jgi:hypothetical protein
MCGVYDSESTLVLGGQEGRQAKCGLLNNPNPYSAVSVPEILILSNMYWYRKQWSY